MKTPLAVLAQEAEQADAAGHYDLAATLRQLVERMQRQVDYSKSQVTSSGSPPNVPLLPPKVTTVHPKDWKLPTKH